MSTNKVFPFITIVTGAPEHGKSYRTIMELENFIKDDPASGRKGMPVIIFDTNDEFSQFQQIRYDVNDPQDNGKYLRLFQKPEIRRIRPFTNGNAMEATQKQKVMKDILNNFRRGAVLLDDINNYIMNYNDIGVTSFLCNSRHRGIDLIIQFQSAAKIATTMWENMKVLRMHYQVDDVDRYDDRIPNFELIKVAQTIINTVYFSRGENSKYFFLYVDVRNQKIIGAPKTLFLNAVTDYVKKYKRLPMKQDMAANKLTLQQALTRQVQELYKKYYPSK